MRMNGLNRLAFHKKGNIIYYTILLVNLVILLMSITTVSAQFDLPPGIRAIKDYNQQYALEFMQIITIPLVFLAGILSILSPCILPLIPAFFSYTFKEKKRITKMTTVFFLGFTAVFVTMGVAAALVGQSIISLQAGMPYLIALAGMGLIFFGVLGFFGKGFSSVIKTRFKKGTDTGGVFVMGLLFAIGWSACLGPIIAGLLLVAAIPGNVAYAALMLFVYSLGIMAPLLVISLFYDRLNLGSNRWVRGREVRIKVLGKSFMTHTTEMLSGTLLISLGLIFIIFQGTNIINSISPIGSSILFNELQRSLLEFPVGSSAIGIGVIVLLLLGTIHVLRKRKL
jgi:cytochrome c-type biogenesis protein